MAKENNPLLPEEEAAETLEILLRQSTEQYRVLAQKAAKKPYFIIYNKTEWIGWMLMLALGIIIGASIVLYSLRREEVDAVFATETKKIDAVETRPLLSINPIPERTKKDKTIQKKHSPPIMESEPIVKIPVQIPIKIPIRIQIKQYPPRLKSLGGIFCKKKTNPPLQLMLRRGV